MPVGMKVAFIALLVLLPAAAAAQDASRTYAEAVYQETMVGELGQAIMLYKQVAKTSDNPSLAARATLRTGNCYRKLGQTELAREAYRRVVDQFNSEKETVRLAKLALLALGPGEEELKKWSGRLKAQVTGLKAALEAVNSGLAKARAGLKGKSGSESGEALRAFEEMIVREEMRERVRRYLASHYFRTGLHNYQTLGYEGALEDFRVALSLHPDDALIRGYLEKTEFILGRRPKLTPAARSSAPEDPPAQLVKELSAAYELAEAAKEEGDHRMALAAVEQLLERVRWTDDALVTPEVRKLLQDADALAEECLIRLYPAESRELKMLTDERRELAGKLKRKLDEMLSSPPEAQGSAAVLAKARELLDAGRLPEAKQLLESRLAEAPQDKEARTLLEGICAAARGEPAGEGKDLRFSVLAAAIVLPGKELGSLKIPFQAVKSSDRESVPFAWALLNEEKGREVLSVASLVGPEAVGKFSDIKVTSGEKGSRFLGSSMTYVSGYRRAKRAAPLSTAPLTKRTGEQEKGEQPSAYEPVSDIVFQGIKLSVTPKVRPASGAGRVALRVEVTVSVIAGEPRVVQTPEGQIEIPRVYQVALQHTFELETGQYLIISSFPNTLVPGTAKEKQDMYLLLSPRRVKSPPGAPGKENQPEK